MGVDGFVLEGCVVFVSRLLSFFLSPPSLYSVFIILDVNNEYYVCLVQSFVGFLQNKIFR